MCRIYKIYLSLSLLFRVNRNFLCIFLDTCVRCMCLIGIVQWYLERNNRVHTFILNGTLKRWYIRLICHRYFYAQFSRSKKCLNLWLLHGKIINHYINIYIFVLKIISRALLFLFLKWYPIFKFSTSLHIIFHHNMISSPIICIEWIFSNISVATWDSNNYYIPLIEFRPIITE